ncbi:hypothetical protein B0T24DRAFT_421793 [Lasiosphaeria ovina]|uniref:Ubiquitin-like protease family profile domain-containing protein n=1 Tax=Lasiosphaeria ovina TaxID=92902 RepID=A0AAE0JV67_9PEZI|nr:hypothetical protein B0T24DRAFT_421793 [Lasiosphaeria ovina]
MDSRVIAQSVENTNDEAGRGRMKFALGGFKIFILPVNLSNTHWVAVKVDCARRKITIADSMRSDHHDIQSRTCIEAFIKTYLPADCQAPEGETTIWTSWSAESAACLQQEDGYDCGIYTLVAAFRFMLGLKLDRKMHVATVRRWLLSLVQRGTQSPIYEEAEILQQSEQNVIRVAPPVMLEAPSSTALNLKTPITIADVPAHLVALDRYTHEVTAYHTWCLEMCTIRRQAVAEAAISSIRQTRKSCRLQIGTLRLLVDGLSQLQSQEETAEMKFQKALADETRMEEVVKIVANIAGHEDSVGQVNEIMHQNLASRRRLWDRRRKLLEGAKPRVLGSQLVIRRSVSMLVAVCRKFEEQIKELQGN